MYQSLNEVAAKVIYRKKEQSPITSMKDWAKENHYDSQSTAGTGMIHTIGTTSAKNSKVQHAHLSNALTSAGYTKHSSFDGTGTNNTSWSHPKNNSVHTSYSTEDQKNNTRHGVSFTTSD